MKLRSLIYSGAVLLTAAAAPATALAVVNNPFQTGPTTQVGLLQARTGLTASATLPQIIGNIINVLLSFMGVLLLVYIIYAGFLWMTSDGDAGTKKAKDMIKNAVIGLVIIVSAFAISNFVLTQLAGLQSTS